MPQPMVVAPRNEHHTSPHAQEFHDTKRGPAPLVGPLRLTLFPARLFLALGWTRAGVEKLIDGQWWSGTYVREFLVDQRESALPIANWLAGPIASEPVAVGVSLFVLVAELMLGWFLFTGRRLPMALTVACALNVAFVALGTVNPSAFYLVIQMTLFLSLSATGPTPSAKRSLFAIGGCLVVAGSLAPFITTLHPHGVIDDPAIMLATLALLSATTLAIRLFDHHQATRAWRDGAVNSAARNLRAWAIWRS